MIWLIVIQTLIIIILVISLLSHRKALNVMLELWAEEKNRQWIETLEKTGAEIIYMEDRK